MFGQYFYNKHIRNTIIAFGTIFNTVSIRRYDSSGNPVSSLRVPLMYAPREKFLARLQQQTQLGAGDEEKVAITLPRLSFEMTGFSYDPSRKINKMQKYKTAKSADDKNVFSQYAPVPYNVNINLYSFCANSDDSLQILEQILPFFQPDYTVTFIEDKTMDIKRDIPIVLNSVNYEDTYSGDFSQRRAVIYTLGFTAKTYLFGPASTQKVIKETQTDLYSDTDTTNKAREMRIVITPNPTTADADDDFGFTTTIDFFEDSKKYNVTKDTDE